MRFRLQVDGDEHRVATGADGALTIGEDKFVARVTAPSPDRRIIQVDDATYEVRIVEEQPNPGTYVLEVAGERIWLTVSDVTRGRAAGAAKATPAGANVAVPAATPPANALGPAEIANGEVRAPMPGKVVRLLVEVGQEVEAGQVLLILEAMKMENELRAPRKGIVTSVHVKEGDPVEAGGRLLAIGPSPPAT